MKNHEEFRNAVFNKAKEYEKKKREKRQAVLRGVTATASCLLIAAVLITIPINVINKRSSTMVPPGTVIEGKTEASVPEMTDTSSDVTGALPSTTGEIPYTTGVYSSTTSPVGTSDLTNSTTSVVPYPFENADSYYFNGANVFRKEYNYDEYKLVEEYKIFYSYEDFKNNATELEYNYFPTEESWNENSSDNAVLYVTLNCNSGSIRPCFDTIIYSDDFTKATVKINYVCPEVGTCDMASWNMLIQFRGVDATKIENIEFEIEYVSAE